MFKFVRNNRVMNFVYITGVAMIFKIFLDFLFGGGIFDDLADAFGWTILGLVIVLWGEELMDAVDDVLKPTSNMVYFLLAALPSLSVVAIAVINPADNMLSRIAIGAVAAFGLYVVYDYSAGREHREIMRQRRLVRA